MDLGRLGLSPFLPLLCTVCVRCQVRADGTGSVDVRPWSVTPAMPHTSDHRVLPARPWLSDGGVRGQRRTLCGPTLLHKQQ